MKSKTSLNFTHGRVAKAYDNVGVRDNDIREASLLVGAENCDKVTMWLVTD